MPSGARARRHPARIFLIALVAIACAGSGCSKAPKHVILIVVDTLRADYGGAAAPGLTRLAHEGSAPPALASFHQTSASMGTLWTGVTPSLESGDPAHALPWTGANWCGLARFGTGETGSECLPRRLTTLPERLHAAGYRTVGIASNNLLFRPAGFDRGFDVWREVADISQRNPKEGLSAFARRMNASRSAAQVRKAVLDAVDAAPSPRLFLYVHFMDAHDWYVLGDPRQSWNDTKLYGNAVTALDTELSGLVEDLRARGLLDDTLLIVTADHGEALGEPHPIEAGKTHFGNPSYDSLLHIPLLIWPRQQSLAGLGRTEDLHRWILARAAITAAPPPSVLEPGELFLTEVSYQTLRVGRWKLTRERATGRSLLFDLDADPGETRDLAATEPTVRERLVARTDALAATLAAQPHPESSIRDADADRLRALGYLQ